MTSPQTRHDIPRAAALGALGSALLALNLPASAQVAQTAPIRIGAPASDSFAIAFFAVDGGFFSRAGLDVTATVFPGSGAVTAAVVGGALEAGLTDAVQLGNAFNHNVPISAFAGGGIYETKGDKVTALCVTKTSSIHTAKDFEGQTIALITLESISAAAVRAWLTTHGANTQNIKFIEMPYAQMGPALARGTVGGIYIAEPVMSQILPDVRVVASPYDAIGPHLLTSTWFATQDWLDKNRDTTKKMVRAIYDASRWANDHHDLTLPILEKYAKLDTTRVQGMHRTRFATSLDPRLLQPVLDAAATYHLIDKPVQAASVIAR